MKFDEFQLISKMTQNVAGFKNPCGGSLHSSAWLVVFGSKTVKVAQQCFSVFSAMESLCNNSLPIELSQTPGGRPRSPAFVWSTFPYWSLQKQVPCKWTESLLVAPLWLRSNQILIYLPQLFQEYPKYIPTIPTICSYTQPTMGCWLLTLPFLRWVSCLHCSNLSVRRMCTARQRGREPWQMEATFLGRGAIQGNLTSQNGNLTSQNWMLPHQKKGKKTVSHPTLPEGNLSNQHGRALGWFKMKCRFSDNKGKGC